MNINKIDEEINKISQEVVLITNVIPSNLKTEKRKFFKSNDYNPIFQYPKTNIDLKDVEEKLNLIKCDDSVIGKLLCEKIKMTKGKINLIKSIGKDNFSEQSQKYFGKPSKELVKKAEKDLESVDVNIKKNMLPTEEVVKRIRKIIKDYKLSWKVMIRDDMIPRISVNITSKKIFIRKNARFSEEMLNGTIAHEIETHVFRVENGLLQPFKIFSTGFPNYEATEEGLAIINAETVCPIKKLSNQSALRLIGINVALQSSFREVFNMVLESGYAKNIAWNIALRSKRGMIFTEKPGAFTKDYLYFKGKDIVNEFIRKKGDITKLYYGKIGIEHVKLLPKIKGLKKPKFVPKFINEL